MKTKADKKTTNDIYLLASGARGYNNELSLNALTYYAIGTGRVRALIELLDIAPNLYFENKAVKKAVDSAINRSSDYASILHLVALKEYADATETTSFIGVNKNKSNDFIERSMHNRNLTSRLISILCDDIVRLESEDFSDPQLKDKYSALEDAKKDLEKYSNIANLLNNVGIAFTRARSAYLDEAKSLNPADAQVSKAKAHLIDKKYNLGKEEKGDYSLLSLSVASKICPSLEKDYFVAQCLAFDSKITESDYLRTLMNIAHENKPSRESVAAVDVGMEIEKFEDAKPRLLFLDPNQPIDYPPKDSSNPPKLLDPNEPIDYPTNPHFFNGEFKSYSPSPIFGGDND